MEEAGWKDKLNFWIQRLLPQHALSALMGWLSRRRAPKGLLTPILRWFCGRYGVDLSESASPLEDFSSFDEFFTRPLRPGARAIDPAGDAIVSPVDGAVSAAGEIKAGALFQAKGRPYSLAELVGEAPGALEGGTFATLYLSPRDYHRIHAPCDLSVRGYSYFPGSLFSVNPSTERAFPEVFARNERVAFHCESSKGPFVLVMVGALIVGSIEAAWEGVLAPNAAGRKPVVRNYQGGEIRLAKGQELGRFHLGSTVILLFPRETGRLAPLASEAPVRLGQRIGRLLV